MSERFKCPLCGAGARENIIDPKRTHEAILAHDGLHETIRELRAENADLLAALRLCLPIVTAHTQASHLTDGFRPRRNENDCLLDRVKGAISQAEMPGREG